MRVLLVEDDDGVADALVEALRANGHRPTRVRRGADALIAHRDADVVLLDLGLPDQDGLEVLRKLRKIDPVPVLVLTARGDERTVVRGLRLGADDYLVKPVRLAELLARIDAVARRSAARSQEPEDVVRVSDVEIDLQGRQVVVGGREISLTTKEFDVLAVLARTARHGGEPAAADGRGVGQRVRRGVADAGRAPHAAARQARPAGAAAHDPRFRLPAR